MQRKRDLDGEDRSAIIRGEGKGGRPVDKINHLGAFQSIRASPGRAPAPRPAPRPPPHPLRPDRIRSDHHRGRLRL